MTNFREICTLHFIESQLNRVRRVSGHILPTVKYCGGIINISTKAIKLFRNEGLAGIKRGIGLFVRADKNIRNKAEEARRKDYTLWIQRYDTLTKETRKILCERINGLSYKPLISVVMPVYNPNSEWLIAAIESVKTQIYSNWELCIADDASTNITIRTILDRYANEDSRIKVIYRKKNGHISAASNSALKLVSSEWVALLDHDDLLSEHALYWVADAISKNPTIALMYTDEDRIDEMGNRSIPYFKCDWNVDLFYSQNMFSHLGVYRFDMIKAVGGFRVGLEGSQDYDLALRCIERIEPKQIHHIPRILYHWRVHAESTSKSLQSKPYATLAGERALNEHFERQKILAKSEFIGTGYRTSYALPSPEPLVSLIISTRNGLEPIRKCIESIIKGTSYKNYEILMVVNSSNAQLTTDYLDLERSEDRVRVVYENRLYNDAALNNAAVKLALGEVVCLLSGELEVISPEWLTEMVSIALQLNVGAVGPRLLHSDDTLQHGGFILGLGKSRICGYAHDAFPRKHNGYFGRAALINSFSAISGACLAVQKSIYEAIGGFDDRDLQIAFTDVDFCLRLKEAGYRNVWTPYAELYNHALPTACNNSHELDHQERFHTDVQYMKSRWGKLLSRDPAYSPNLTLDYSDFSYAWPPRLEVFGIHEEETTSNLSRVEKALFMIDRSGLGLEIGPSHNPLTPKKQGFNVHVLDHAPVEDLREKYKLHNVVLENIEEVDFVWQGEPLFELIGNVECYDWIIASHVIEHTPDMITFLEECERLLKPGGILSLVIPDKRYCFDYFNPVTWTGELLDAYDQKRKRPSPGKVFEHCAGACYLNGKFAWSKGTTGLFTIGDFNDARNAWEKSTKTNEYIDVHNWRFTPASFRLLLSDLQSLGLTKLSVVKEFDTTGCEFFVILSKTTPDMIPSRLELLNAASIDGHGI
jgi:O-antigen biosynthesis protein